MPRKRRSYDHDASAYSTPPGLLSEEKIVDAAPEPFVEADEQLSKENFGDTALRRERDERHRISREAGNRH